MTTAYVDVAIIGAGISGIDAAYHLQTRCPTKTYAILEARDSLGGTWDLFRYPGIRSDSDMYTLGFPFRPWTGAAAIADGPSILQYLRDTAAEYGIDKHIRYGQRVERARWSSADARWTIETASGTLACSFLYLCVGYYDYANGYTPAFPGRERFTGTVIHPQDWPADLDYSGKRIVVIGSGATAVTLVPALAERAAHVTMLQRSPTYIVTIPARDPIAQLTRRWLPERTAFSVTRWKSVLVAMAFYELSRRFPERVKRLLVKRVEQQLRGSGNIADFTPSYKPWDQRVCLVPDADLFRVLRNGRAEVVTGTIKTFTETGIELDSGAQLPADIIVTATGLQLACFGKIALDVDGRRVDPAKTLVYKGMMCSGVPNMAFAVGYSNASWTLKCDLTSRYVCRLLAHMDEHGYAQCVPNRDAGVEEVPLIDFTSGYIRRSIDQFPRQGSVRPWRLYQNYAIDLVALARSRLEDPAIEFSVRDTRARAR